jgi:single-strand DNA-binding protein
MADNTITLVGNITRDPELRFTQTGRGVASFGIAVNRRYQVNGEWQEQTSFFNIVAWGTLGENAAASLNKGDRVIVYGRLEQRSWETQDGEKRSVVEVIADEMGPSVRWAQAHIEKIARSSGDSGGGGGGGGGAGGGGGQAAPSSGAARPAGEDVGAGYAEDPF